ncbi:MAG: formylglycine-generating enzyme family protein, partial [Bacteroidota bacterium]
RDERENPIINLAADLLEAPFSDGVIPLKILFSPPELDYDVNKSQNSGLRIESFLAEEIKQFLKQGYDLNNKERPTQFLDKAWSSKKFGGGAAVQSLHNQLKTIPILILESEFVDNYINLRYCYWDGEQNSLVEDSLLSRYPYRDFLYDSAKSRAKEWKKTKAELLQDGLDETTVKILAKAFDEENLAILEREEQIVTKLRESGRDISKLNLGKSYKLSKEDYEAFHDYLAVLHCLTIGTIVDLQALQRSYTLNPLLPRLLPNLLNKLNTSTEDNREIVKPIVKIYRCFYQGLEEQTVFSSLIPDITLDFALSLADLQDKIFAVEEAKYSASDWLKLHGVEPDKIFDLNNEEDCQSIKSIIYQEDEAYLSKLQQLVEKVGETADGLVQIKSLLAGWQNLKRWGEIPSLFDEEEVNAEEPRVEVNEKQKNERESDSELSVFSFETVRVNKEGKIIERETRQAKYYTEILPGGVELEMVYVPGGTFMMGSPEDEEGRDKCFSRHCSEAERENYIRENGHPEQLTQLTVPSFYMSKYPITVEQWAAVAELPSIKYHVEKYPSWSGNQKYPITNVNYIDAFEFCQRISKIKEKPYVLPHSAIWEYACRAETNTSFYFGEIITKQLANFCIISKNSLSMKILIGN